MFINSLSLLVMRNISLLYENNIVYIYIMPEKCVSTKCNVLGHKVTVKPVQNGHSKIDKTKIFMKMVA